MAPRTRIALAGALLVLPVESCGCQEETFNWDGFFDTGLDPTDQMGDIPPDTYVDIPVPDAPDHTGDDVCDEHDFPIHHEIVRLMLLLDQSSSMEGTRWNQATSALEALLTNPAFYDMHFGLDPFPDGYPGFWTDCGSLCLRCREDECGTLAPPMVATAPQYLSAPPIIDHMHDSDYPQFCTFTPLVNQMQYYATGPGPTDAPEMYSEEGSSYLVVISDGEDTGCYSGSPTSALADATSTILDTHGIRSFAIGFGSTSGEMAAELNAIASNGGTSFTTFLHAEDGAALEAALEDIASDVLTCRYVIDSVAPSADPELVNFYIDGIIVPFDEGCTETTGSGWHWFDAGHTTVEFCGEFCTDIKAGDVETIGATFGCDSFII